MARWMPPLAVCSDCGRERPCYGAKTETPVCKSCANKRSPKPIAICSSCGRERPCIRAKTDAPLCGSDGNEASSCNRAPEARSEGVTTMRFCTDPAQPSKVSIVGLAPDGVGLVELRRDGEVVAKAPVKANAFMITGYAVDTLALQGAGEVELPGAPAVC